MFQAAPVTMEEPGANSIQVALPIVRIAGTIGTVAVQWRATVNGRPAVGDIRPASGEVSFAPGETMKTLRVEILADDVPEIQEVRKALGWFPGLRQILNGNHTFSGHSLLKVVFGLWCWTSSWVGFTGSCRLYKVCYCIVFF